MLTLASAAWSRDGCGQGAHRGTDGRCRFNGQPIHPQDKVVDSPAVGVFYPGRGWWDGSRYWPNRDPSNGGWRYH